MYWEIAITSDKKGNSAFGSAYFSTSEKLERKTKRSLQIKTLTRIFQTFTQYP